MCSFRRKRGILNCILLGTPFLWCGPPVPPGRPPLYHWLKLLFGRLILGRKAVLTSSITRARPPVPPGRLPPGRFFFQKVSLQQPLSQVGKAVVTPSPNVRLLHLFRRGPQNHRLGIILGPLPTSETLCHLLGHWVFLVSVFLLHGSQDQGLFWLFLSRGSKGGLSETSVRNHFLITALLNLNIPPYLSTWIFVFFYQ